MVDKSSKSPSKKARIEAVKRRCEDIGPWGINKSALAKEFGVSRQTIHSDLQEIFESVEYDDLKTNALAFNIYFCHKKSLMELMKIISTSQNADLTIRAAYAMSTVIEKFTNFLEAFGMKPRTPDKLEVKTVGVDIGISDEHIKDIIRRYSEAHSK